MNIKELLGKKILFFDGAMGTMLQKNGLKGGDVPEFLNITSPDLIYKIHCEYLEAGADIITTNTFGANALKSDDIASSLEEVSKAAVNIAKKAIMQYSDKPRFVAFDIGPTGRLLEPLGDLTFDECYNSFKQVAIIAEKSGADLVLIETMSDTLEAKAAVLAVKENTSLPVFCTMTFDENKKTLTGADVKVMCAIMEGLGADCIGINCGLGPEQIAKMMEELSAVASIPIMAQPNAGLPTVVNGKTVYNVSPMQFGEECMQIAELGASIIGGCCGTTPEHISELVKKCSSFSPVVEEKDFTVVASYSKTVYIDKTPVIIGERINPTGKKKFKEALRNEDMNYIIGEAIKQAEAGAHILDVNVGLPEIDEPYLMEKAVKCISSAVNLPLQIDSSDVKTLDRALRIYNGKPMVNSVNGKEESLSEILPIVKKYGGVLVGLCLDENGISPDAEGRVAVARKIKDKANEYGIKSKDLVMDALTLTISAQQSEAAQTIKALKMIKDELGVKTVLGVSNISFGLPKREIINSTFFALALNSGLDACIINPCSDDMMNAYYAYKALTGLDENCSEYVERYAAEKTETAVAKNEKAPAKENVHSELYNAVVKGLRDASFDITVEMLKTYKPMDIINGELIPALDAVGKEFEKGVMFLPQLMMSAETVKRSFDAIKENIEASGIVQESKGKILIATVKGDIHDIGKNIVKVLLENYGYDVLDMGKDVSAEDIVRELKENNIPICGLSALMTTTVVSMEETIKLIRKEAPDVKVFVGGAVLTQEYANMIGADAYCADALLAVNFAKKFFGN